MSGRVTRTSNGSPELKFHTPPSCHPPSSPFTSGVAWLPNFLPAPNGNSYRPEMLTLCRTSKLLFPRSRRKLVGSCVVFASLDPPVLPMLCPQVHCDPTVRPDA